MTNNHWWDGESNLDIRLQHHILPDRRSTEPIPDLHDHDRRQRVLYSNLILHHRKVRTPTTTHLGRCGNDNQRVRHRHRRHSIRRLESGKLRLDRLRLSVHLLLCFVSSPCSELITTTLTNTSPAPGAQQAGSSSERSSSCPSAPRASPSLPPPIGSGTASLVSTPTTPENPKR